MTRYFFNIIDGKLLVDEQGLELSGMDEARSQAIETAGAMLRDQGRRAWGGTEWQMIVTNEARETVLKLRFSAEETTR